MKIFSRVLIGLLVSGILLGGLWVGLRPRGEPEVIKIYRAVPYELGQVNTAQARQSNMTKTPDGSEVRQSTNSAKIENVEDTLFRELGLSPEEKADFWEWLVAQETDPLNTVGSLSDEAVNATEFPEGNVSAKIDYEELYAQVVAIYELEDVLKDYGLQFSGPTRSAVCPFCNQRTFRTHFDAATGRRSWWHCNTCTPRLGHVISFVARIEGLSGNQAAEFLSGLLE